LTAVTASPATPRRFAWSWTSALAGAIVAAGLAAFAYLVGARYGTPFVVATVVRAQRPTSVHTGDAALVLGDGFAGIEIEASTGVVVVGGATSLPVVARRTAAAGLTGFEWAVGVPGSMGGAVRMNANAYGGELGRVLESVTVCMPSGPEQRGPEELGFRYRGSNLGDREVVALAGFGLSDANPADVKATMADMRRRRKEAQPSGIKTFGSTFVNPEDARADGRSAGQLLDAAGCRGLQVGGARLSPKHANFVENVDRATSADCLALMTEARRRARDRFGVELEREVVLVGEVGEPG